MGSSQTRDRTHVPCTGRWILNHWTTREVPPYLFPGPSLLWLSASLCVCVAFYYLLCVCTISCVSVQFSSITQSCLTLCDPVDCSMPGLPVQHQLWEFTQTHVHWLSLHLICFKWIYVYNMNWIKFYFMNKFIQLMQQHLLKTFLFSLFYIHQK